MIHICEIPDFKMWYDTLLNIPDVAIEFTIDGIKVCMVNKEKSFIINSVLKTKVENTCSIAISMDKIKTIKGKVDLYWDKNQLIIKSGIVKYKCSNIVDPNVKTLSPMPDLKFENSLINLPKDQINEMLKVSEKEENLRFKSIGKNLIISNDEGDVEAEYVDVITDDIDIDSLFNYIYMKNVLGTIKYFDNFKIRLGFESPAVFSMSNDLFDVEYRIAPRIEDDD
jgi:hypothetical protein